MQNRPTAPVPPICRANLSGQAFILLRFCVRALASVYLVWRLQVDHSFRVLLGGLAEVLEELMHVTAVLLRQLVFCSVNFLKNRIIL